MGIKKGLKLTILLKTKEIILYVATLAFLNFPQPHIYIYTHNHTYTYTHTTTHTYIYTHNHTHIHSLSFMYTLDLGKSNIRSVSCVPDTVLQVMGNGWEVYGLHRLYIVVLLTRHRHKDWSHISFPEMKDHTLIYPRKSFSAYKNYSIY